MNVPKFWPLVDYDPEGEVYDNVAWDLPGFRPARVAAGRKQSGPKRALSMAKPQDCRNSQ
jgi:hypothetical protein